MFQEINIPHDQQQISYDKINNDNPKGSPDIDVAVFHADSNSVSGNPFYGLAD